MAKKVAHVNKLDEDVDNTLRSYLTPLMLAREEDIESGKIKERLGTRGRRRVRSNSAISNDTQTWTAKKSMAQFKFVEKLAVFLDIPVHFLKEIANVTDPTIELTDIQVRTIFMWVLNPERWYTCFEIAKSFEKIWDKRYLGAVNRARANKGLPPTKNIASKYPGEVYLMRREEWLRKKQVKKEWEKRMARVEAATLRKLEMEYHKKQSGL